MPSVTLTGSLEQKCWCWQAASEWTGPQHQDNYSLLLVRAGLIKSEAAVYLLKKTKVLGFTLEERRVPDGKYWLNCRKVLILSKWKASCLRVPLKEREVLSKINELPRRLSPRLFFSACGSKLVAAIRAALVKGRGSGDAVLAAANETAQELKERICQLHHIQKQSGANSGGIGISPARVSTTRSGTEIHTVRVHGHYLTCSPGVPFPVGAWNVSMISHLFCTAKGVHDQSRHRVWRPGHSEGADGSSGRGSSVATMSEQGRPAVWGPACCQWRRGEQLPHAVQVEKNIHSGQVPCNDLWPFVPRLPLGSFLISLYQNLVKLASKLKRSLKNCEQHFLLS